MPGLRKSAATVRALHVTGYVSPYGKPRGLAARLSQWASRMGTDRSLPWAGLGIIEDLRLAAQVLNKREWLEKLYLSDDPEAQRFAAEALADDETLEAMQDAADRAQASTEPYSGADPVAVIEQLDEAVLAARRDYEAVRDVLVQAGALADDDKETPVADLLRMLLS